MLEASHTASHRVLPDGCTDLLFTFSASGVTTHYIGPMTHPHLTTLSARTAFMGIRFRPGVFMEPLLPGRFQNSSVQLGSSPLGAFDVGGYRFQVPSLEAIDDWVGDLTLKHLLKRDEIVSAALRSDAAFSTRTLQRHFMRYCGLTQATLKRITRLQRAVEAIRQGEALVEVALATGYADQAHMTRDFKQLTGLTPGQFTD
jgi:AraC-like DNA-binding protein